jgi:hypothetical protein
MNTHAIGIEAANDGVGQPWPQEQIDSYFAVNNALAAAYGLLPADCCTHQEWAPTRKIDPAVATSVYGPWMPGSVTSSGTWSVTDIRAEANRRAPTAPPPSGDDDMPKNVYYRNGEDRTWNGNAYPAGQIKYLLQNDGKPRRVDGEEIADREGIPATSVGIDFGIPKSNARLDEIGAPN